MPGIGCGLQARELQPRATGRRVPVAQRGLGTSQSSPRKRGF